MAKIAETLPAGDLLTLRKTCTTWNSHFIPEIRRKHAPIKLQTDSIQRPSGTWIQERPVKKFARVMRSSEKIPYTRYEIGDKVGFPQMERGFGEFAAVCGESVTSLRIMKVKQMSEV